MNNRGQWESERKCNDLTPEETDTLFFPGVEGKRGSRGSPKKTSRFCHGCLVRKECVQLATEYDLDGTWGGTTKKERMAMAALMKLEVHRLTSVLPPEPKRVDANGKRIARYKNVTVQVTREVDRVMDEAVNPLD